MRAAVGQAQKAYFCLRRSRVARFAAVDRCILQLMSSHMEVHA
jgi:hypothetical protein